MYLTARLKRLGDFLIKKLELPTPKREKQEIILKFVSTVFLVILHFRLQIGNEGLNKEKLASNFEPFVNLFVSTKFH